MAKKITSLTALHEFQKSDTYQNILSYVTKLSNSVIGKTNTSPCTISATVQTLLDLVQEMKSWITEIPAEPTESRFGNHAFRTYCDRLEERAPILVSKILTASQSSHTSDVAVYLINCVGDRQRIDYGSGHELNFICFLYSLTQLNLLNDEDSTALVLRLFNSYLDLMRTIQKTYWLEPAGSRGVWGLDDYHFLPFLFGSAQLIDHKHIRPRSIGQDDIIEGFADAYMYLGCIRFINQVKMGSFFEHSPLLWDISGAKSWRKVHEGLTKMFQIEVLGKLPVMQHFFFGSLIPFEPSERASVGTVDDCGHEHAHGSHETEDTSLDSQPKFRPISCCVQKVPSAIGAKEFSSRT
eukprot:TRINITY_DN10101_c0_g1_i1.p1 TRINITY_DN10101_c0_g1~~TRINITY_DN10101_c0_g1_i1.p1  ORF type:complete len:352 (+),score=50.94 TRINITY_DN10101_c0_g1_i1:1-1056(+)